MSDHPINRRRFKRIAFDAITTLSQGDTVWSAQLVDLSLKGLLAHQPDKWPDDAAGIFLVDIRLAKNAHVKMDAELVHVDHHHLGFKCLHIGLESIQHLRRLVELNLGDEEELERELDALFES
ncbi:MULTISPECIES: PilZ domain-containing protein [Pseudomonas]|uniref:Cyclic diguanosine monophosphate-binding protein n=1 Tax=Pseudomonas asplenii TaxID=53407 RepID=A0A0M9GEV4_9PSED|nr:MULTISPECIES: PilZ domain-containing protein [Pseudomonas]KPA89207.1 PilZ domain-containing protein [Pseudomonas fuscovaginae]KPA96735.1 PilZ domain-containing protein [Pseudomonas fuscovaginae]